MTRNGRTRRAVLGTVVGGATLAAAAGCGWLGGGGGSDAGARSKPSPLAPALAATLTLIDLYTATMAGQPSLTGKLDPLLADHRAHVTALNAAMAPASAAPTGPATGSPSAGAGVPPDPAEALAAVRAAEQAARDSAVRDCLAAQPRYASLLGSIAACRSCHLEVLV
ncbi:hypothetical protein [Rugosimonospora africana]|nr:hypothetical protein [Rugosimonospora africana]